MKLYLDDNSTSAVLIRLLRQAGHDVEIPANAGLAGRSDAVHLRHAIQGSRVVLTYDHRDFLELHELLMEGRGHHPGILAVRNDGDPKKDLKPWQIVRAIGNFLAAKMPLTDE